MATSGPPIKETQAVVRLWTDWFRRAHGAELADGLIKIREAGIDPFEAVSPLGFGASRSPASMSPMARWASCPGCAPTASSPAGRPRNGSASPRQLEQLPQTQKAFANGELGYQPVAVLARTAEHIGVAAVRQAEASLLKAAETMDPGQFNGVAKQFEHRVDAEAALTEANRAYERRYLHVSEPTDGLVRLDGLLDVEGGAILRTAINATDDARQRRRPYPGPAAPTPWSNSADQRPAGQPTARHPGPTWSSGPAWTRCWERSAPPPGNGRGAGRYRPRRSAGWPAMPRSPASQVGASWKPKSAMPRGRSPRPPVGRWRAGTGRVWRAAATDRRGGRIATSSWALDPGRPDTLPNLVLQCRRHHRMVHEGGWGLRPEDHGRWRLVPPVKRIAAHARSA